MQNSPNQTLPQYLYKYRPFDRHAASWIAEKEIFLSYPFTLNDPFDCKARFNYDISQEKFIELAQAQGMAQGAIVKYLENDKFLKPECYKTFVESIQRWLNSNPVLSLSELGLDLSMFAYYGSGHSGYCLRYDARMLEQAFCNALNYDFRSGDKPLQPVKYHVELPQATPSFFKPPDPALTTLVLTKARCWKLEREWRVVWITGTCAQSPLERLRDGCIYSEIPGHGIVFHQGKSALKAVIVGCRMDPATKKYVKFLAREAGINYIETWESRTQFGLESDEASKQGSSCGK